MSFNISDEDKKGYILIIGAIAITFFIGYLAISVQSKNKYNEVTLCPLEIPYNTTVLIIDKSDSWSSNNSLKIKKLLEKTSRNLGKFDRLTIKVIEPDEFKNTVVETYFDMCNPGNEANPFYENPRRILKKYTSFFKNPLEKIMKTLSLPEVSNTTPLLSTIRESLVGRQSGSVDLIIVSDLLEYSDDYNFYKQQPDTLDIIQKLSMPLDKLHSLHVEYILRKRVKQKVYSAIDLYENLALALGGKFSKNQMMSVRE